MNNLYNKLFGKTDLLQSSVSGRKRENTERGTISEEFYAAKEVVAMGKSKKAAKGKAPNLKVADDASLDCKTGETPSQTGETPSQLDTSATQVDDEKVSTLSENQRIIKEAKNTIDIISSEFTLLSKEVKEFAGTKNGKSAHVLEEQLTMLLLRLDDVETRGDKEIRAQRGRTITAVKKCIQELHKNAPENMRNSPQKPEVTVFDGTINLEDFGFISLEDREKGGDDVIVSSEEEQNKDKFETQSLVSSSTSVNSHSEDEMEVATMYSEELTDPQLQESSSSAKIDSPTFVSSYQGDEENLIDVHSETASHDYDNQYAVLEVPSVKTVKVNPGEKMEKQQQVRPLHQFSTPVTSRPMQLLRLVDERFELNEEVLQQMLCAEEVRSRKLVVISVVGESRDGKDHFRNSNDHLLNFVLRYFKAGRQHEWLDDRKLVNLTWHEDDVDPRGVFVWPETFLIGDDLAVVLMSFESATAEVDAFQFMFSTLASSVQILSMSEGLNMDRLTSLQYFLQFGRITFDHCDVKAFQKLVFLVQDWQSRHEAQCGSAGGDKLLRNWLKGASLLQDDMLHTCFKDISCFLMPPQKEQHEFHQYVWKFVETVLSTSQLAPKQVGHELILAGEFITYLRNCLVQLQQPDFDPVMLFQSMSDISHDKVALQSSQRYFETFTTSVTLTTDIEGLHNTMQKQALQAYDNTKKFGNQETNIRFRKNMIEAFRNFYEDFAAKHKEKVRLELKEEISSTIEKSFLDYQVAIMAYCVLPDPGTTLKDTHVKFSTEAVKVLRQLEGKVTKEKLNSELKKLEKKMQSVYTLLEPRDRQRRALEAKTEAEKELSAAFEKALRIYRAAMDAQCGGARAVAQLEPVHQAALAKAREIMRKAASKYESKVFTPYEKKLLEQLTELHNTYACQNNEKLKVEHGEMAKSLLGKALQDSVEMYRKGMEGRCMTPMSGEEFERAHYVVFMKALESFKELKNKFSLEETKPYFEQAKEDIEEQKDAFKTISDELRVKDRKDKLQASRNAALKSYRSEMASVVTDRYLANLQQCHLSARKIALDFFQAVNDGSGDFNDCIKSTEKAIDELYAPMEKKNRDLKDVETNTTVGEAIKKSVDHYERTMQTKCKNLKLGSGVDDMHFAAMQEALGEFRSNTEQIQHFESYSDYLKEAQMQLKSCKSKFEKFMSKKEKEITEGMKKAVSSAVQIYCQGIEGVPKGDQDWDPNIHQTHIKYKNTAILNMMEQFSQIEDTTPAEKNQIIYDFNMEIEEKYSKYLQLNTEKEEAYKQSTSEAIKAAFRSSLSKYKEDMEVEMTTAETAIAFAKQHKKIREKCIIKFEKLTYKYDEQDITQHYLEELKHDIKISYEMLEEEFAKLKRKKRLAETEGDNYAIGIDLGTTYTCVAVYKDNNVNIIQNSIMKKTTPSVVYFDVNGQKFGETAIYSGYTDPRNCVSEVKRIIGMKFDDPTVKKFKKLWNFDVTEDIGGNLAISVTKGAKKLWRPEEVSELLLGEVKRMAEACLGLMVHDAVVTIPAYFNELQREATKMACVKAGLNVLRMINEPTAAAIAYGMQKKSAASRTILVFDFGGGTCDVSVLVVQGGRFTIKASRGDNQLGGEDFDNLLTTHLAGIFKKKHKKELSKPDLRRLRHQCERAKRHLTDETKFHLEMERIADDDDNDMGDESTTFTYVVDRCEFEKVNASLFPRALIPVEECLREAGVRKDQIDDIVLVGGSSRIPKIQQMLQTFFNGKSLNCSINADEAIAYGAAIQAAIITEKCSEDIKIFDITPISLGIGLVFDKVSIIVPKNSALPTEKTQRYVTVSDYQKAICVEVFQGENKTDKKANTLLGKFTLSGIKKARAGQTEVDVTFKLDHNGILHVTAMEVNDANNEMSLTINRTFV